jgi:hypothetical protein
VPRQNHSTIIQRMKAALVTPFLNHLPLYPSAFMGYGAAVLKQRYELEVIDLNAAIYFKNRALFKEALSDIRNNDIILDSYHLYPLYLKLLKRAAKEYERIPWSNYETVFITMPSWFVNIPTENVLSLANAIRNQSPESEIHFFGNSLGSWTNENRLRRNRIKVAHLNDLFKKKAVRKPVDYDCLPTPIYEKRDKYIFDILPFRLKHGCIWAKCKFCSLAKGWNSGYKERKPKTVIEEIGELNDRYRPRMLTCNDNSINGRILLKFCDDFKYINKAWAAMARADLSAKEITALQKSGCKLIYFGLESGSDRVLNQIGKGINSTQMSNFIRGLYDNNIMPAPSLMAGIPGETEKDFEETIKFISRHKNYLKIVNCYPFMITPASNFSLIPEASGTETLVRLAKLIKACADMGIKVCVGEQSAEYVLYHEVYPDKNQFSQIVADRKGPAGLSTEGSENNLHRPFSV